jgi:VanZ family protein
VVLWLLVIVLESSAMLGADHTTGPLQRFFEIFHGPYTFDDWWNWHRKIRKTGHIIGYGVLSILFFRAFSMTFRVYANLRSRRLSAHALALAGTFAVASLDEFHQTFLPNRTGLFSDVLIDTGGALAAQLLVLIWISSRKRQ